MQLPLGLKLDDISIDAALEKEQHFLQGSAPPKRRASTHRFAVSCRFSFLNLCSQCKPRSRRKLLGVLAILSPPAAVYSRPPSDASVFIILYCGKASGGATDSPAPESTRIDTIYHPFWNSIETFSCKNALKLVLD